VESGARGLLEQLLPKLRESWGDSVPIDLVTCYARIPQGFPQESTRVYRVTGYREREGRLGRMLFAVTEESWTNQQGAPVKRAEMTLIRY